MKLFFVLVFTLISIVGFSQIYSFSKTTQILDKPHGIPVLQLDAGVEYWRIKNEKDSAWTKIIVPCFIKQTDIQNNEVQKQAMLFNCNGDIIGISLQKINIETFQHSYCINLNNSLDFLICRSGGIYRNRSVARILSHC